MKSLNSFIIEKILINKNTKIKKPDWDPETQYDKIAIYKWHHILNYKSPQMEYVDHEKMENYYRKGSIPSRLINSIKNKEKLCKRFNIAINMHWLEYAEIAKDEIINRGYFTVDEVNSYIEYLYNKYLTYSKNNPNNIKIQKLIEILDDLRYWAK